MSSASGSRTHVSHGDVAINLLKCVQVIKRQKTLQQRLDESNNRKTLQIELATNPRSMREGFDLSLRPQQCKSVLESPVCLGMALRRGTTCSLPQRKCFPFSLLRRGSGFLMPMYCRVVQRSRLCWQPQDARHGTHHGARGEPQRGSNITSSYGETSSGQPAAQDGAHLHTGNCGAASAASTSPLMMFPQCLPPSLANLALVLEATLNTHTQILCSHCTSPWGSQGALGGHHPH